VDITVSTPVHTPQLDNVKTESAENGRALEAIAKRARVSHMTAFQCRELPNAKDIWVLRRVLQTSLIE